MSRVRIVQLLCPQRHCILASAYESEDGEPYPEMLAAVEEKAKAMITANEMNPWCGLCRSRDLHAEDGVTKYATLEEAMPHLMERAAEQATTREFFRAQRN